MVYEIHDDGAYHRITCFLTTQHHYLGLIATENPFAFTYHL